MTATFLGPDGQPLLFAKDKPPLAGEIITAWNGERYDHYGKTPTQFNLGFDTSKLTLPDYRLMREHHQVASSLRLVSMMMHQRPWRLIGDRQKEVKHCTENLKMIWTRLVRANSTALWSGFSPCATQWENDLGGGKLWLTKIKDLRPETAQVRWKEIPGKSEQKNGVNRSLPQKVPVFDGILQKGWPDIPVSNSYWYTLLREEGDYYGTKLLNAAYRPWYFSMVMHLYANRYMERFAEPTPVGRAPFDEEIEIGGRKYSGNRVMSSLLGQQRNGGIIVLPNSRTVDSLKGDAVYDYTLEYVESQLRGVEFDRIIAMYDEEISLALFTPLLLMRNMDVGSSNLGVVHTETWLTILNALSGDWEEYINRYIITPMAIHNFGPRAKIPRIEFRPLGRTDGETIRAIVQSLMGAGKIKFDFEELGSVLGLNIEEQEELAKEDDDEGNIERTPSGDERVGRPGKNKTPTGVDKVRKVADKIAARVDDQATKAFAENAWDDYTPDLGFRKQFTEALAGEVDEWQAGEIYAEIQRATERLASEKPGAFASQGGAFADACRGVILAVTERGLNAPAYA